MQANNMQESFLQLLRKLKAISKSQLPEEREKIFKSFAESLKVDDEQFKCHYVSLAIVCQEPITSNGEQISSASLELHALNLDRGRDLHISLIIDHKKEVSEYLNQDEVVIVENLIRAFEELNQRFASSF